MKENRRISFLVSVFFVGILLSVALYLGLGSKAERSSAEEGERSLYFNQLFYEDQGLDSLIKYVNYKVFRHLDDERLIVGESDWLFERTREDNGYDYLLDYVGGCPYTEEQMSQIAHTVGLRRQACANREAEYLLVIIPNSMTAASHCLPAYIGAQSEHARLNELMTYLSERGESGVLDLRAVMAKASADEQLYNNTEDSINAYGAFSVYNAALDEIFGEDVTLAEHRLQRESIQFFTHYTEGKSVAKKVGVEHLVYNRTVSLSETMADFYWMTDMTEYCVTTKMNEGEGDSRRVVIECSTEWDKIQLMPFFSNTFETTVYENTITDGISALDYHNGDVLIQIIHESELDMLLE